MAATKMHRFQNRIRNIKRGVTFEDKTVKGK